MIADADDREAPVSYRIDSARRVVYFTLRGDVTFAALCTVEDAYLADPAYDERMCVLVECLELTSIPSRDEIRKLALDRLMRATHAAAGKTAIVVGTRLGIDFAVAWELFAGSTNAAVRVFSSSAEAHAWLGVPFDEAAD